MGSKLKCDLDVAADDISISVSRSEALLRGLLSLFFAAGFVWLEIANVYETGRLSKLTGSGTALEPLAPFWHWAFTAFGVAIFGSVALTSLNCAKDGAMVWTVDGQVHVRRLLGSRTMRSETIDHIRVVGSSESQRLVLASSTGRSVRAPRIPPQDTTWQEASVELMKWARESSQAARSADSAAPQTS